MLISQSESVFREIISQYGKSLGQLLPEEMLDLGFTFYGSTRATDALPLNDASFGDALLFQWGTREALLPHYDACYYFDLTRQFISQQGEDDDAIFQLTCQLQYELTPRLRTIKTGHRWCSSLEALPGFKIFAFEHPALTAVAHQTAITVELYLTTV